MPDPGLVFENPLFAARCRVANILLRLPSRVSTPSKLRVECLRFRNFAEVKTLALISPSASLRRG